MVYLEISELLLIIKDALPNKKFKIIGEVSKPNISNGNLYFSLQDKNGSIRTILWKSNMKNDYTIKDGDKIGVKGKLDFYNSNGSISFIITKILKYNGEGDLYKLFERNKKILEKKGYFSQLNKLKIPKKIKNILLLTSKDGRAYTDILHVFNKNKSKINYDLKNVSVQGKNCPSDICYQLSKLNQKYDLIVITRGGGEYKDLFGFCIPDLIETVFNFRQPVLSAIGHKDDTTLLDLVADAVSSTPTDAAQYIIDINKSYVNNLNIKKRKINRKLVENQMNYLRSLKKLKNKLFQFRKELIHNLRDYKNKFKKILHNIPNKKLKKISNLEKQLKSEFNFFVEFKNNKKNKLKISIKTYIIKLENLKELLDKKQEITLYCDDKEITNPSKLNKKILKNSNIKLVWNNFKYDVKFSNPQLILK
jgi:exodeoxyribonuclease VII large subunit